MASIIRRKFLATVAALTAGIATKSFSLQTINNSDMKLVHHVFFWLKNPDSIEDRDQLIAGLRTLGAINAIGKLHIGVPAPTEKRDVVDASWQVSELMFFENTEAQKTYQDHPIHQSFIKNYGHLWQKVVVYDVEER